MSDLENKFFEARQELIKSIRERLSDAGGSAAVARRMGFTKSNLWYYLSETNFTVSNTEMLTKISNTVATMITEKKQAAIEAMQGAGEKLQQA